VSAIVTAYNRADTVRRAIESIQAQTMSDLEIVVVDDASQDNTIDVVLSIDEPRLRLVRNVRNRGIGGAKNVGVENAGGEYIAFLDSDDTWEADKLEKQLPAVSERRRTPLAFTAFWLHREGDEKSQCRRPQRYGNWLRSILMGEVLGLGSTLLATRQCFETVGYFDESLRRVQDRDWTLRYLRRWDDFEYLDEPLVHVFNTGFPGPQLVQASVDNLFALHQQQLRERDPALVRTFRAGLDFEVAVAKYRSGDPNGALRTFLAACANSPTTSLYFFRRAARKFFHMDFA
jgi:glycosyltransferase involved in cell wall biosynthesis